MCSPKCRRYHGACCTTAETLLLPLYVGMTEAEQDEVIEALLAALDGGR